MIALARREFREIELHIRQLEMGQRQQQHRRRNSEDERDHHRDAVAHHGEGQNQSEGDGSNQRHAHRRDQPPGRPGHPLGGSPAFSWLRSRHAGSGRRKNLLSIKVVVGRKKLLGVNLRQPLHQSGRMIKVHRLRPARDDEEQQKRRKENAEIEVSSPNQEKPFAVHKPKHNRSSLCSKPYLET